MVHSSAWDIEASRAIIGRLSHLEGALLPILHALQHEFGYVDDAAIDPIADALNLSKAEVFGTLTFYHEFRRTPPKAHIVRLCRAEACQANGSEELAALIAGRYELDANGASADRSLVIEAVYCLGNCALGPNALVGDELVGRLDEDSLVALCESKAEECA